MDFLTLRWISLIKVDPRFWVIGNSENLFIGKGNRRQQSRPLNGPSRFQLLQYGASFPGLREAALRTWGCKLRPWHLSHVPHLNCLSSFSRKYILQTVEVTETSSARSMAAISGSSVDKDLVERLLRIWKVTREAIFSAQHGGNLGVVSGQRLLRDYFGSGQ